MIGKATQSKTPHDQIRNRRIEKRDIPTHQRIFRLRPFPPEFGQWPPIQLEAKHSRKGRAPHDADDIEASARSKCVCPQDQKIKNRAEEEHKKQVHCNLLSRSSEFGHVNLTIGKSSICGGFSLPEMRPSSLASTPPAPAVQFPSGFQTHPVPERPPPPAPVRSYAEALCSSFPREGH